MWTKQDVELLGLRYLAEGTAIPELRKKFTVPAIQSKARSLGINNKGKNVPVASRFFLMVNRTGNCWLWTGFRDKAGYGKFGMGKEQMAHRASWIIHNGPIPRGLDVCHTCDNPPCVRPDHLFLGTQLDNTRDMIEKGRAKVNKGEKVGTSKLTADRVLDIRGLYSKGDISQSDLGKMFGVARATIRDVVVRRQWRHI